jgi:hypothetical protein
MKNKRTALGISAGFILMAGCASSNHNAVVFQGGTYKLSGPSGIAIDGAGNVWVTNTKNDTVTELKGVAVPVGGWNTGMPPSSSMNQSGQQSEKIYPLNPKNKNPDPATAP